MQWIAPSEKDTDTQTLERRLWDAADQLRANSGLTSAQYSQPVLGLIFLRFAEVRFLKRRAVLEKQAGGGRRPVNVDDATRYHAEGVLYLTPRARFDHLLRLPQGGDIGSAVNDAMRDIETQNPQLAGVLPKTYQIFNGVLLKDLLKRVSEIPATTEGDAFGRIYEYFLGEFARTEGQRGGEFYTPSGIVRLLVEVLEPFHGRILDPACGSGGMFVQSARFVTEHRRNPSTELSVHGQEKVAETVKLCRMNLAVHGLEGDIREGISYYDDLHHAPGRFDFVLANPPFNVNAVDKERLEGDTGKGRRFPFGLPRADNANYLWIQLFYSALKATGRAGFVMANSASDARSSEQDIRRQMVEDHAVDHRRRRPEHVLHGHPAGDAVVPGPGQEEDGQGRPGAVPRCPSRLPPDRPGAPGLDPGADRLSRECRAAVSRGGPGLHPWRRRGRRQVEGGRWPEVEVRRRARPVQGGHAEGDRGAGLVAQPWPLRGRRAGGSGERRRLQGTARDPERGA